MAFWDASGGREREGQGPLADQERKPEIPAMGPEPIEPGGSNKGKAFFSRWIFFALVLLYILLSHFHVPILTAIGRYLVVEQPLQKSDLAVCLAGGNIDRGLATADIYREGLARQIFVAREERPDGYEILLRRGIRYPETLDLLVEMFKAVGVPRSAVFTTEKPVKSTLEEARAVRAFVERGKQKSLILITSPTHTRRVWLTFRKIFKGTGVRILVKATPYSGFRPKGWWKHRRYVRAVIIEYQKLIYYRLKYLM